MPESVRDQATSAHEHVFLLSKRPEYYYDSDAIAEVAKYFGDHRASRSDTRKLVDPMCADNGSRARTGNPIGATRNARNVWTISPHGYKGAHFAVMPPLLVEKCILAGSRPGDTVIDPFSGAGTTSMVAQRLGRSSVGIELNPEYTALAQARMTAALRTYSDGAATCLTD